MEGYWVHVTFPTYRTICFEGYSLTWIPYFLLTFPVVHCIMLNSDKDVRMNTWGLVDSFVTNATKYYGPIFTTYKVHNGIYIHYDVKSLDEILIFSIRKSFANIEKICLKITESQVVKRAYGLETNASTGNNKKLTTKSFSTKIGINDKNNWLLSNFVKYDFISNKIENDWFKCNVVPSRYLYSFYI